MSKKILIDMVQLREHQENRPDGILKEQPFNTQFKSIRELATFYFSCRKCTDAPCIGICPADALEKEENEMITRALNLCIRCKSCVIICPFGTIMPDLFEKKSREYYFDLNDEEELKRFVELSPANSVEFYEGNEDPDKHIYQLTENILVRDYVWDQ